MIERKIIIGLITNTEFLKQIQDDWNNEYLESNTARTLSLWCWEYFRKYKKAPKRNIEIIFIKKLKKGLDENFASEMEEEILPELSNEYEKETYHLDALLDETRKYFTERQLTIHKETLETLLEKNEIENAVSHMENFRLKSFGNEDGLDLADKEIILPKLKEVFDTNLEHLIKFPGALGSFWNDSFIRGGFVSLLAPEKRYKSWMLLEFMMRALRQNKKVAFFQAGDMTENQQLMRICIYLSKKSNKEKYCGDVFIPVKDCIKNQTDNCNKPIRESGFGIFKKLEEEVRKEITIDELKKAYKENPNYRNCYNCPEFYENKWGAVWLQKKTIKTPLTIYDARKQIKKFFIQNKKKVRLSTYSNGTLSVPKIESIMDSWERKGFVPDIVIIDYADILEGNKRLELRHQENEKWKQLRKLSQDKNCLVITATQADAKSYEKDLLTQTNFSEDKRKYAHVTAMFGLNQDKEGREKKLGVMRINQLIAREDEFIVTDTIKVLQSISTGQPYLDSYI